MYFDRMLKKLMFMKTQEAEFFLEMEKQKKMFEHEEQRREMRHEHLKNARFQTKQKEEGYGSSDTGSYHERKPVEHEYELGIEDHIDKKLGKLKDLNQFPTVEEYKFQMEDLNKRLKAAMDFIADQRLSYNKELLLLKSKCSLGS